MYIDENNAVILISDEIINDIYNLQRITEPRLHL